jgi:subtilisin family serine protease
MLKLWAFMLLFATFSMVQAAEVAPQPGTIAAPSIGTDSPFAPGHVLVKIADGVNHQNFLKRANAAGFGLRGRVYNSNWYTLYIPAGTNPQAGARIAGALRGAARASVDLRVHMLVDTVPPQDPFYQDGATYCDPLFELCIDQWGLFKVDAESAWLKQTGSSGVVIAVIDSGVDLDHDDLYGNIWTNPGEIAGNGIDDDGNGIVDDSNGVDFSGSNVGGLSDDPADEDGNPDIPMGGSWYTDPTNVLGLSFAGDAAVGDNIDETISTIIATVIPTSGYFTAPRLQVSQRRWPITSCPVPLPLMRAWPGLAGIAASCPSASSTPRAMRFCPTLHPGLTMPRQKVPT